MEYKGKNLILDNFRTILKGYSVDIQDIVRSAILDGVDISSYLDACKDNPFRLDQIRLCLKEGMSNQFLSITDGELLYRVRDLKGKKSLKSLEQQLSKGALSNEYLDKALTWLEEGVDFSGINISIIPKNLLADFDYGLRNGLNMKPFNTGTSFSPGYIRQCLAIQSNGKSISRLLPPHLELKSDLLQQLVSLSKVKDNSLWNRVVSNIHKDTTSSRLKLLIALAKQNVVLDSLQEFTYDSKYKYSEESLECILEAIDKGLQWKLFFGDVSDPDRMHKMLREHDVNSNRKVSGRLRKV